MQTSPNPWVQTWADRDKRSSQHEASCSPAPTVAESQGRLGPQSGIAPPDTVDRLPRHVVSRAARLWWVGTHGGAGETTLAGLFEQSADSGHAWPVPAEPGTSGELPVVLVARTHLPGLLSAQRAIVEWAAGEVPAVRLLGLVLVPDAPGRLPRPLRELAQVISGGSPRTWQLPWAEQWRTDPARLENAPGTVRRVLSDLSDLLRAHQPVPLTKKGSP